MTLVETIIEKIDFVEFASQYTKLTDLGRGKHRGLSPFKSEKTPSFYVNADAKLFKCFSSGFSGGVLKFVELVENVNTPDAITILVNYLNLDVLPTESDSVHARLRNLFKQSHLYFQSKLPLGLDYLGKRHISEKVAKKYELGFAVGDELIQYLITNGNTEEDITLSGLGYLDSNNKVRASFRNRVMIPIKNNYGQVVSFTGRDVTGQSKAKYKHGHNNPLFNKSNTLWNLSDVRKTIQQKEMVIVVEGQLDAIQVTEADFPAVAILGSSMLDNQVKILSNLAPKIYHIFDSDSAGELALLQAFKKFSEKDLDSVFYAVVIPEVKDADEYIVTFGKEKFAELIKNANSDTTAIVQALIKTNAGKAKNKTALIQRIINDVRPYVTNKNYFSHRGLDIIERIGQEFGINSDYLRTQFLDSRNYKISETDVKKNIEFDAPIYEKRILYTVLTNPEKVLFITSRNISFKDFDSFLVSKILSNIKPDWTIHNIFTNLEQVLTKEEFEIISNFYLQGLSNTDFEISLNVLEYKIQQREKNTNPKVNFLGRPLNSTQKNSIPAMKERLYGHQE